MLARWPSGVKTFGSNFRAPVVGAELAALARYLIIVSVLSILPHIACAEQSTPESDATAPGARLVVWCYDTTRDVVFRDLRSSCRGRVVSDAEAREIRSRRVREIQKALAVQRLTIAGERLARIGTAFFVDGEGHLITNDHVVNGCKTVTVDVPDGKTFPARVDAVDAYHDLALLGLRIRSPVMAKFRGQDLTKPGAFVAAIGYPDQGLAPREPLVTTGILMRPPVGTTWGEEIAVKGDIRLGNSGSPLLDRYGLVVGVINAKINVVKYYQETGSLPPDIGVGLSLPVVLAFLQKNRIHYEYGHDGPRLSPKEILAAARPYMGRAECWR